MKRVAVLVQNLHNGGAERMAANLSLQLQRYYDVYMIVFDGSNAIYPCAKKRIDLKVPPLEEASVLQRMKNIITRSRRLAWLKKKHHIDCCISHMEGANLVNILSSRKDRAICVYHSMPSLCEEGGFSAKVLHGLIGRWSDRYLTVSRLAQKDMEQHFGVPQEKLGCIYNFSDLDRIEKRREEALPQEAEAFFAMHGKVIVTMGRLVEMKAQDRLIRILAQLRQNMEDVGLLILGEGEERAKLESLTQELGLAGHVYLPGEVENPFPYLCASRVFALPSDFEGLPMVLIEAAACELPVVSCDVKSGPREVLAPDTDIERQTQQIEYAQYGVLVPPCSAESRRGELGKNESLLCEALERMLTDDELRQHYREHSMECAQRFSAKRIGEEWRALIGD